MTIIDKARSFAESKHKGQLDDEGKDYYLSHLEPVGRSVSIIIHDEDVIASAFLHDVLEDTDTSYDELVNEFNKRVADLVYELTDEGKKDSYGKYFPRLKSKEAITIKLIDRASNISRMNSWNKKRQEQYIKKTKFWKDGTDIIIIKEE